MSPGGCACMCRKKEKNVMSDKETKEMIRTTMINLYKFMWEKSNFFIGNI